MIWVFGGVGQGGVPVSMSLKRNGVISCNLETFDSLALSCNFFYDTSDFSPRRHASNKNFVIQEAER